MKFSLRIIETHTCVQFCILLICLFAEDGSQRTVPAGIGGSDHDYTRTRTPPASDDKLQPPSKIPPKFTTPKPRGKENRELQQIRKEAAALAVVGDRKRPLPTSKAVVSFKPRNQIEEYNVLYSFLIRGENLIK